MIFLAHLGSWLEDLLDVLPLSFLAWILFGLAALVDALVLVLGPSETQYSSCFSLRFLDCDLEHHACWPQVGPVEVALDCCFRWPFAIHVDLNHLALLRLLASCLGVELQNRHLHLRKLKLKWGGYHLHRLLLLLLVQ